MYFVPQPPAGPKPLTATIIFRQHFAQLRRDVATFSVEEANELVAVFHRAAAAKRRQTGPALRIVGGRRWF